MKRPGFQSRILVALTLISLILGQTMFSAQAQDATPEAADAATPDAIAADPTATATSTPATAAPTQTATTAPSPTSTKIPTAVPPTATSKPAFTGSATPTITISPTTGRVDTNLKVIVAGFPANVTVYIKFDDTVMTKLTSSSTGGGTTYFKVPAGPKGPHIVKAVAGSISAKTTFTMIPRIRLSPVSGWIGSSLGISLRGYHRVRTSRFAGTAPKRPTRCSSRSPCPAPAAAIQRFSCRPASPATIKLSARGRLAITHPPCSRLRSPFQRPPGRQPSPQRQP